MWNVPVNKAHGEITLQKPLIPRTFRSTPKRNYYHLHPVVPGTANSNNQLRLKETDYSLRLSEARSHNPTSLIYLGLPTNPLNILATMSFVQPSARQGDERDSPYHRCRQNCHQFQHCRWNFVQFNCGRHLLRRPFSTRRMSREESCYYQAPPLRNPQNKNGGSP